MVYGYWAHPFLYFSIVFFTLRFWMVFFSVFDRFWVPWRFPLGACGVTLHPFFPLPIFSRFLRCVFLTFGLPGGVLEKVGGMRAAPLWGAGKTALWLHN